MLRDIYKKYPKETVGLLSLLSLAVLALIANLNTNECKSIYSQISSHEELLRQEIISLQKYEGLPQAINGPIGNSILTSDNILNRELQEVWKLGINNPQCMTNTQKIYLDHDDNWRGATYLYLNPMGDSWVVQKYKDYSSIFDQ